MTYETIDWEAEAKRVARAFGAIGECEFVPTEFANEMDFRDKAEGHRIRIGDQLYLHATYALYVRSFSLWDVWQGLLRRQGEIDVKWNNLAIAQPNPPEVNRCFAHALFHLDLLTPQVEAELGVSVSAHERMEWTLEHEARMAGL